MWDVVSILISFLPSPSISAGRPSGITCAIFLDLWTHSSVIDLYWVNVCRVAAVMKGILGQQVGG